MAYPNGLVSCTLQHTYPVTSASRSERQERVDVVLEHRVSVLVGVRRGDDDTVDFLVEEEVSVEPGTRVRLDGVSGGGVPCAAEKLIEGHGAFAVNRDPLAALDHALLTVAEARCLELEGWLNAVGVLAGLLVRFLRANYLDGLDDHLVRVRTGGLEVGGLRGVGLDHWHGTVLTELQGLSCPAERLTGCPRQQVWKREEPRLGGDEGER